jgi:1-pyrroline-4-hydroxy-2-carboxylate deaminase
MTLTFRGVLPAVTTPFSEADTVDHDFLAGHVLWLIDNGCDGVIVCGSLGEGGSLSADEKLAIARTAVMSLEGRAPVVTAIGASSTRDAVHLAEGAAAAGSSGLMVLPPYLYLGDDAEIAAHVGAVMDATDLPCMLYNNPIAYGTDFRPTTILRLAENHQKLVAVKESSLDVRRITELRALGGDLMVISVGVDDLVVEGARAGATGWVSGVANAIPRESVWLFNAVVDGRDESRAYAAALPLMRLVTDTKFVQLIKAVQTALGQSQPRVRPPRKPLTEPELSVVDEAVSTLRRDRPGSFPQSTLHPSSLAAR